MDPFGFEVSRLGSTRFCREQHGASLQIANCTRGVSTLLRGDWSHLSISGASSAFTYFSSVLQYKPQKWDQEALSAPNALWTRGRMQNPGKNYFLFLTAECRTYHVGPATYFVRPGAKCSCGVSWPKVINHFKIATAEQETEQEAPLGAGPCVSVPVTQLDAVSLDLVLRGDHKTTP